MSNLLTEMLAFCDSFGLGLWRQIGVEHVIIVLQCDCNVQSITEQVDIKMKAMAVSLQNQKTALQLKYLIQSKTEQSQKQLIQALNRIYPFTEYPLTSSPPLQLFETHHQQLITENICEELVNYSYVVVTGGLVVKKGQHEFVENQLLTIDCQQQILFNIRQPGVLLKALPNTCYLKIHNIWLQMAKKNKKKQTEDFIKIKLLAIPFFAALSFQEFSKCCKAAYTMLLGPGDVLLRNGDTPYNMYIVVEGELVYERKVKLIKDRELWADVINQLQRQEDDTCEQMFNYLVKEPKPKQDAFQVIFKLKNISQNEIICAKETICEEKLTYDIVSSLKTKLICIKYPDFYSLSSDRLADIRLWPSFIRNDVDLRKDYYYQIRWQDFKQQVKNESKLKKLEKQRFEDFLRKAVNLSQEKHYYCPHKVGEGNIIDSPASKVSKLKSMTYSKQK